MKKLLLNLMFLACSFLAKTQGCFPDGISFSNQQAIDNFVIENPDCTVIEGPVTISGPDITNLAGLSRLTRIELDLRIEKTGLRNLEGLNNLQKIGRDFSVVSNTSLINFKGLNNLVSIDRDFLISLNTSLDDLSGLENLTTIGNSLSVYSNSLKTFTGIEALSSVGSFFLSYNYLLTQLYGFKSLHSLGSFQMVSNNYLGNFAGLEALDSIRNDFNISDNGSLINFSGLNNLVSVNGSFIISNNYQLQNFDGLSKLHNVSAIFAINSNPRLKNLSGLQTLAKIGDNFILNNNTSLVSIDSLVSLNSVNGTFSITYNPVLRDCSGMPVLTTINELEIENNDGLTSLNGFENLATINGSLSITSNKRLHSIESLGRLTDINGSFIIRNNDSLFSLTNLQSLTGIDRLQITSNRMLNDLTGFNHPCVINRALNIYANFNLNECAVKTVCDHIYNHPEKVSIYNNGNGCNSRDIVKLACGNILPLNILSFTAATINRTTSLKWAISNGTDINYFVVEYANAAPQNFTSVATINATETQGNIADYTFIHKYPLNGNNFYRLKIVNKNGIVSYSNNIMINFSGASAIVYPNPASQKIFLSIPGNYSGELRIFSSLGRLCIKKLIYNTNTAIPISTLSPGNYYIEFITGSGIYKSTFVKQ